MEFLLPRALLMSMSSSLYCNLAAVMVLDMLLVVVLRSADDVMYSVTS